MYLIDHSHLCIWKLDFKAYLPSYQNLGDEEEDDLVILLIHSYFKGEEVENLPLGEEDLLLISLEFTCLKDLH